MDLRESVERAIAALARLGGLNAVQAQNVIQKHLGPATGSAYGSAITLLGDRDGDGIADYAIGVPGAGSHAGAIDVLSGAGGSLLFSITGSGSGTFGDAISDAGDVDLDRIPDLLVGDPGFDDPNQKLIAKGAVRKYSGKDGSMIHEVFGDRDQCALGAIVASLPDADNARVPEIVGSRASTSAGSIEVVAVSGSSDALMYSIDSGVSFVVGSDRDGDGGRDVLMLSGIWVGAFSGKTGAQIGYLNLSGGSMQPQSAISPVEIEDDDGDGQREILVVVLGSCCWPVSGVHSISSGYLLGGGDDSMSPLESLPDVDGDVLDEVCTGASLFSGQGPQNPGSYARFYDVPGGASMRALADLNGGGRADVALGEPSYVDSNRVLRSIVYVRASNDLWLNATPKSQSTWGPLALTARACPRAT